MGPSRRNHHGRAGLCPAPFFKSNRGDYYITPDIIPHTLSIPALIGHKAFAAPDTGFYAMKGNDAVCHGVITAEKRSRSRSHASSAGGDSVMNAGCHPTIRVRISECGRKKPSPLVGHSYSKSGGVTTTASGYYADSRREKQGKPYEGVPWLRIMIEIMVIITLVLLFMVLSG